MKPRFKIYCSDFILVDHDKRNFEAAQYSCDLRELHYLDFHKALRKVLSIGSTWKEYYLRRN